VAILNLKKREIACKIVYYGPARCGKTTNLEYLYRTYRKQARSDMVSINTENDRTLFFDFLPIEIGKLRDCDVLVQLYTVPGQIKYSSTRRLVLRGVDGIVFVADSMEVRKSHNVQVLKELHSNLKEGGLSIFKLPLVMQFNKRDLEGQDVRIMPVAEMERDLNQQLRVSSFPASALEGRGVSTTLQACLKLAFKSIRRDLNF
jgi:signal recognition particle receptor subunit beta